MKRSYTVVGAGENGLALFAHAHGQDAGQVDAVAREYFGDVSVVVLHGHCKAADGAIPQLLGPLVEEALLSGTRAESKILSAYVAWCNQA